MNYRIPFGDLKIGPLARKRVIEALDSNWISEGRFVREFEDKFAEKFGWKHAITTSSGTDAGIVVWSAVRELVKANRGYQTVLTPACAFVATANCLLAAGVNPYFVDVSLDTLNLDPDDLLRKMEKTKVSTSYYPEVRDIGIQFVATMGKPNLVQEIANLAEQHDLYLIGDFCEAHGAVLKGQTHYSWDWNYADHFCDASIYSLYAAHLIVGGEGGIICTDNHELADLCRSIKSHGRPRGSSYFDFQRPGFNSKWKHVLRDADGDIRPLYRALEDAGVQCKTLFGSLPTDHRAFKFLGHRKGDFPVSERVGRTGLHFGCNEFMTDEDVDYVAQVFARYFREAQ